MGLEPIPEHTGHVARRHPRRDAGLSQDTRSQSYTKGRSQIQFTSRQRMCKNMQTLHITILEERLDCYLKNLCVAYLPKYMIYSTNGGVNFTLQHLFNLYNCQRNPKLGIYAVLSGEIKYARSSVQDHIRNIIWHHIKSMPTSGAFWETIHTSCFVRLVEFAKLLLLRKMTSFIKTKVNLVILYS